MARNKGLAEQDLSKLDVAVLHPLSPEVISRQATINIGITFFLCHIHKFDAKEAKDCVSVVISGTIGHVAHGKSTVVKAISGVQVKLIMMPLELIPW